MIADRFYMDAPITLHKMLWFPMRDGKGLANLGCCKVSIGDCLVDELRMDEAAYDALSTSGQLPDCRVFLMDRTGKGEMCIAALYDLSGTIISPKHTPELLRDAFLWEPLKDCAKSAVTVGSVAYTLTAPFGSPPMIFVPAMVGWTILSGAFTFWRNAQDLRVDKDFLDWPEGDVASYLSSLGAGKVDRGQLAGR